MKLKIFSDKQLSQTIERTEARLSADLIESRKILFPAVGAEWIEVAGTCAMFDGAESPLTQTFGLGLFDRIGERELEKIEAFFKSRKAPVLHEVSPLADSSLLVLLNARGYQPVELTNMMFRSLASADEINLPQNPNLTTRMISRDETDIFANTSARVWSAEMPDYGNFMIDFAKVSANCKSAASFIAELDEVPIATGTLLICEEVAELSGAGTIAEFRNLGAQNALLAARLDYARKKGCKIAAMGALPGSQSQRNAEKNGFRIAYTRTKWLLKK